MARSSSGLDDCKRLDGQLTQKRSYIGTIFAYKTGDKMI